ncbi:GntR family transcriptional regulator [Micromonospora sp. M12]
MSGELAPGTLMPSETELADTSGLSRTSVRNAIRQLREWGLVRAEQGAAPTCGHPPAGTPSQHGAVPVGEGSRPTRRGRAVQDWCHRARHRSDRRRSEVPRRILPGGGRCGDGGGLAGRAGDSAAAPGLLDVVAA